MMTGPFEPSMEKKEEHTPRAPVVAWNQESPLQYHVRKTLECHIPDWTLVAFLLTIFSFGGALFTSFALSLRADLFTGAALLPFLAPLVCGSVWAWALGRSPLPRAQVLEALDKALPSEEEALLAATVDFPVRRRTWKALQRTLATVTLDATFKERRAELSQQALQRTEEEFARWKAFSALDPPSLEAQRETPRVEHKERPQKGMERS